MAAALQVPLDPGAFYARGLLEVLSYTPAFGNISSGRHEFSDALHPSFKNPISHFKTYDLLLKWALKFESPLHLTHSEDSASVLTAFHRLYL